MITEREGYEAMLYMLEDYRKLTKSNEITDILAGGEYLYDKTPADTSFWHYWLVAIEKVKKQGPPPLKKIRYTNKDGEEKEDLLINRMLERYKTKK